MSIETMGGVSAPKQDRSRTSFAKVRAAVVALLQQHGSGQFSLAEVSSTAGVSIGSIYGRVGSKAELIRAVQAEEFDRLDEETRRSLEQAGENAADFALAVADVVDAFTARLHAEAPLLAPFFRMSAEDDVIRGRGAQSGVVAEKAFCDALLRVGSSHAVTIDDTSARWAFEVVYSICVRNLGLGMNASTAPGLPLEWTIISAQLARTVNLCIADA